MAKLKNTPKSNPLADLIEQAVSLDDQTETTTGGGDFEREPPAEGVTVGRLIEYIELGVHPRKAHRGKEKTPAELVKVTFELTHPKNIKTIPATAEYEAFSISDKISLMLNKSLNDKAKFKKLFEKLRRGRTEVTHFAQMLGEAFVITVKHNKSEANGKTYANVTDASGNFTIEAPYVIDPISETQKEVPVPEAMSELRLFLWNLPTKETWDSLYIDGTKEVDGKEVSKNWIQEKILSAVNITGSALEQMLEDNGYFEAAEEVAQPAPVKKPAMVAAKVASTPKPSAKTVGAKIASPSKAPVKAAPVDPLVALGLA